ncbi:unnamed protein product [Paramecium pentaurelia]|uniref:Uncharacterized protein n=1 Tax=Paramecium pentaurelia TaxID=43138 RepID=A0A8S1XU33_9CILI|nr:unnamed protein product [Paramecium pentaurelia]
MYFHQERNRLTQHSYYDHLIWLFIILFRHPIDEQSYHYYQKLMYFHQERNRLTLANDHNHLIWLTDRLIITTRSQYISIRKETDRQETITMTIQFGFLLSSLDIPQTNRVIITTRCQCVSIRRETD